MQEPNSKDKEATYNNKRYDLADRTLEFARRIRALIRKLPIKISNNEDFKQVLRSSGSVGANYIEANESLSKKDFLMRVKICRKEAKETAYWLQLIEIEDNGQLHHDLEVLAQEAKELTLIFNSIIRKSSDSLLKTV